VTWLVAGLGNPGERYARTRHNVGAMVADLLASRAGERFRKIRSVPVEAAEVRDAAGERLLLAKSLLYMNESGPSYASVAKRNEIPTERVIACHDDIDLAFGALRLKLAGSTAGHHGLDSMVQAFRSRNFYRVRIGVGRPPGRQDPADFVLQPFARAEQPDVELLIADAADAVESLVRDGLAATQDRFTRSGIDRGSR
jgi:PTH1 family peptidyl-tRNA hydrolase